MFTFYVYLFTGKRNRADLGIPLIVTTPANKQQQPKASPVQEEEVQHPWRRPASLRSRTTAASGLPGSPSGSPRLSAVSSSMAKKESDKDVESSPSDKQLRRVHSFESDEK